MPSTPADTMGVLDMGGASTQMTFVPKNGTGIPPQHKTNFRLYGASYTVYTNSFLCYGLKESGRRHFALLAKVSPTYHCFNIPDKWHYKYGSLILLITYLHIP